MSSLHVLLTGANGFIACHILALLIERNYAVTATARTQQKVDGIIDAHPDWKDKVTFALVPDFSSPRPFDHVFQDAARPFEYVIHAASPLPLHASNILTDVIEPAEHGTREIFESAGRCGGPALKRVVLLGSAVSVLNAFEDMSREGKPYTEKDWNPVIREQAVEKNDTVLGYNASKKLAEMKAWEFMEENRPAFDLVVTNPTLVTGPMIHPVSGPESINATNIYHVAGFLNGMHKTVEEVMFPLWHFVDVRDVARAHVDALRNPAASNRRVLLTGGLFTPQLVVNAIRKRFPGLRERVPEGTPSQILPLDIHPTGYDDSVSREILGKGGGREWSYVDLETSIGDTVQSMLDRGVV